jgi:hypothetical protein
MGKKLYFPTDEGGIQFKTERRVGDVRIPNYIYDLWMPLIGSDAIGVYAVFCRLERSGGIKGITMQDIANACRIGKAKLAKLMKILEECEFIETKKPTGQARLWHYTTEITVKDPAQEISKEIIEEYQPSRGYEPLTPWLSEEESPEIPNGTSDSTKQYVDEIPNGTSTVESSILHPLLVENSAASATPPPPQATEDAQDTQDAQTVEAKAQTLQDVLRMNVKEIKAWAKDATPDERKALVALESKKDKPRQGVLDIAGVVNQRIFNGALYIAYGYQNGDTSFLNKGQVVNLYREARRIEEKGITADDLLRFNEWWQKSNEWKGGGPHLLRKPSLILTKWAEFTAQQQVIRRQAQRQAARYANIEVFG